MALDICCEISDPELLAPTHAQPQPEGVQHLALRTGPRRNKWRVVAVAAAMIVATVGAINVSGGRETTIEREESKLVLVQDKKKKWKDMICQMREPGGTAKRICTHHLRLFYFLALPLRLFSLLSCHTSRLPLPPLPAVTTPQAFPSPYLHDELYEGCCSCSPWCVPGRMGPAGHHRLWTVEK